MKAKGITHLRMQGMMAITIFCLGTALFCCPQAASAHQATVGYSDVYLSDHHIQYQLYLDPVEVAQWMDLHSGGVFIIDPSAKKPETKNGVSWDENDLLPFVEESLMVANQTQSPEPVISQISFKNRADTEYLYMNLDYSFESKIDSYKIKYNFFFDTTDATHQNLVTIHAGDSQLNNVFDQVNRNFANNMLDSEVGKETRVVSLPSWIFTIFDYIRVGIEHILTGYDHLLFIVALVIWRQSLINYLKILSSFTIGHSITIALAALNVVAISPRIIEPLIALSIAYVAVENIWMKKEQARWRWVIALSFGFIHGFGFAQVLQGSLSDRYLLSLFSFNLGVEIGQIAVLAVALPIIIYAGRIRNYRRNMSVASCCIAIIGVYWFLERVS